MIDFFITVMRLPIALASSPLLVIFFALVLPFEIVSQAICFPFAAVFMTRDDIKSSWLGGFPNSWHMMKDSLRKTWQWALHDDGAEVLAATGAERVVSVALLVVVWTAIGYGAGAPFESSIVGAAIGAILGMVLAIFLNQRHFSWLLGTAVLIALGVCAALWVRGRSDGSAPVAVVTESAPTPAKWLTLDGYDSDTDSVIQNIDIWRDYADHAGTVGTGRHGEKVKLIRRQGRGVLIEMQNGTQGWVAPNFIREYKAPTPTPVIKPPTDTPSATPAATPSLTPEVGTAEVDKVLAYNPGPGAKAEHSDPTAVLGERDLTESPCCEGIVQLGRGGSLLLAFTDNTIVDGNGPDFQVFGESANDDYLLIEVSADGQTWHAYPKVSESSPPLDLATVGLTEAVYVRLTDLQPATPTGAEVDAVAALHSSPALDTPLPALPDAVTRDDLELREDPDPQSRVVNRVTAGSQLTLLGQDESGLWVKVRAQDHVAGWLPVDRLGLNVSLKDYPVLLPEATPTSVIPT